jgi:2-hydroxychromene-2-carboxylate isomerase
MTVNLEIFYSFQSPYSYLALESCYRFEDGFDVQLLWHPFSAKASGQEVTRTPINPDKLSYIFEDTKRFADENGIPLVYPQGWPEVEFDPNRMTRGAIAALDLGVLKEFNYKVMHKWWGLGQDPNEEQFLAELCDELDVELGDFISRISASDTRERVKGIYKRGKKLGVFDTPTVMLDRERFVGIDKLPYVTARLEKLGLRRK